MYGLQIYNHILSQIIEIEQRKVVNNLIIADVDVIPIFANVFTYVWIV